MSEPTETEEIDGDSPPLLGSAATKIATAALVACVIGGAIAGGVYLPDDLHVVRRVAGGGVAGFGSWLLVMVGRVIA